MNSRSMKKGAVQKLPLLRIAGYGADKVILLGLLGSVLLFVLWPMVCILVKSLWDGEKVGLAAYEAVWSQYGTVFLRECVPPFYVPCFPPLRLSF